MFFVDVYLDLSPENPFLAGVRLRRRRMLPYFSPSSSVGRALAQESINLGSRFLSPRNGDLTLYL